MLILTRKKEETIKIGDDITVRVLGIQGGNVKLGIVKIFNKLPYF